VALAEARAKRIEFLRPAVAAHPDDVALRTTLAQALAEGEEWDAGRELLQAGLAQQPDDAVLRFQTASFLRQEVQQRIEDAEEQEIRALVDEGLEHVNRAIELEPALYSAYILRVDLQQLGWFKDGSWDSDLRGRQKIVLESLAAALQDTVVLRSIRATLGRGDRLQMIATAFNRALSFYHAAADEALQAQALTFVRRFFQEAQTQYPEYAVVSLMEGYVALVDGDDRLAVMAFSRAEEQAARPGGSLEFGQIAKQELMKLYRKQGQLGLSLRYTEELVDSYRRQGRVPPRSLYINQVEVLHLLDRSQEALDLLESVMLQYPDDPVLRTVQARILTSEGRGDEAAAWLRTSESDSVPVLIERARIVAYNQDYVAAEGLLRHALELRPEHLPTIRLLMQVLLTAQGAEEATQFLQEQIERASDEGLRRVLRSYEVVLSTDDSEQREQRLFELIAEIPDDFERAGEYVSYWVSRGEFERAASYLDQMEGLPKSREDEVRVFRSQFDIALRLENCERAAKYATALARLNADHVGGALFRGQYELHCGDPEKALSEFRVAEREFPSDSELKIHVAQALSLLKPPHLEEAIPTLVQAVEFDPRSFAAHKLLYFCYEQTGRHEQAIRHLELAATLDPDDSFIQENAQLLEEEKDPQRGIERREELRAEQPEDVANLLRLAELYERVSDYEHAAERLRQAVEVEPGNSDVARFAAGFFARRGDREAGEQVLQRHLATQEGLGEIVARLVLARLYDLLGDPEAAFDVYQQARQRVGQALADGPEEDRRRAMVLTASELAGFYGRTQRLEEMIEAYREVLTYLGQDDVASIQETRRNIIRGLLALRKYGDADAEIAAYRQEYPNDPRGMMAKAELLIARHRFPEARELLSQVLERDPDHAWSRYMRGQINIQLGRHADARDDLLRSKSAAPEAFNLQHRLALVQLYEIMDQPELAEAELREMLPLERGEDREVELRLIGLLSKTEQFERAQEFVNELSARDPDEPIWLYQLGRLLIAREEYSAAAQPLQRAVELTEFKNPDVLSEWLLALIRGGRAREAAQICDNLGPELVTARIQTYAAEAYLAQNDREVAVALLEQAVQAGSRHGVGVVRLVVARAMELLGEQEGLAVLRRVLEHAPNPQADLALRSTLAGHLASDEDPDRRAEGLELAKEVIAAAPPGGLLHQEALLLQALALDREGRSEQAVRTYEELLRLVPDNLKALNNLAYMLADRLGRAAEALPYAERLRELASGKSKTVFLDTVAWVYFKNDKREQAEAVLLEALRLEPDYLAARYHLGQIYVSSGNRGAAERAFRRVLELADQQENEEYRKKAEEALEQLRR
jgi:tetratricopeptide (TPR) repeat protein